MKTISALYTPLPDYSGFGGKLRRAALLRGRNGLALQMLRLSVRAVRNENSSVSRYALCKNLLRYTIGFAAAERLLPYSPHVEYTGERLYHLADVRSLDAIRRSGLLPQDGWVYLTDEVSAIAPFYAKWKAYQLGTDLRLAVITVDAAKLAGRHKIYYARFIHEFITERVEPEYLLFDEP